MADLCYINLIRVIYKMIKAIIFDLDGTLVNSLTDLAISTNYSLEKHGFPSYPIEDYKYLVGDGMVKLIERAIPSDKFTKDIFNSVFDGFMAYYRQNFLVNTVAYDGIFEALNTLSAMGLKLAVVSNKADEMTKRVVSEIFGDGIFLKVAGKREGYPVKPDPTLTLEIIGKLGVKPQECAFVGDSGIDIATAVNSGCFPLGVLWGFRTKKELLENGAKALASEPFEIVEIIKGILND